MERAISATEANQRFSEMLREVQSGASFTVTSRGKPVARLVPFDDEQRQRRKHADALLDLLREQPFEVIGPWKREDLYD
jgi:prevent-host-death family protein